MCIFLGYRLGDGDQRRQPPPPATRSWGYGPQDINDQPGHPQGDSVSDYSAYSDDPELAEALRQSEASYRAETASERYTPSAPHYDDVVEGEGVLYPDLVGLRPPLYAANPGPPPRGGWRLPEQPR